MASTSKPTKSRAAASNQQSVAKRIACEFFFNLCYRLKREKIIAGLLHVRVCVCVGCI